MNEIYKSDEFEYYHRLEEFPKYAISNWGNLININNGYMRKWTKSTKKTPRSERIPKKRISFEAFSWLSNCPPYSRK